MREIQRQARVGCEREEANNRGTCMRQNRGNTVVQVDNWLMCALFLSDKR